MAEVEVENCPTWQDQLETFARHERLSGWAIGDTIRVVIAMSPRSERMRVLNEAATILRCSASKVRVLGLLSNAFPEETRHADVPQSIFRACMLAAKRLNKTPGEVLDDALAAGWHTADIAKLGCVAVRGSKSEWRGVCEGCGASLKLTHQAQFRGMPIKCGFCVVQGERNGQESKMLPAVGLLA